MILVLCTVAYLNMLNTSVCEIQSHGDVRAELALLKVCLNDGTSLDALPGLGQPHCSAGLPTVAQHSTASRDSPREEQAETEAIPSLGSCLQSVLFPACDEEATNGSL